MEVLFPALRLRDHGLVMSPELIQSGWQPRDGWMTVEQWEKWVLDGWMEAHQDVLASHHAALTEAASAIRATGMELASELSGAGGAFEKGVDKAWTQWLKKFRRALKSGDRKHGVPLRRRRNPHAGRSASGPVGQLACARRGGGECVERGVDGGA